MKTFRKYVAKCHVCGGKGCHDEEFATALGLDYIPECSICNGNGFVSIICEEDPVLVEIFTVPDWEEKDGRRHTLAEFENPYAGIDPGDLE